MRKTGMLSTGKMNPDRSRAGNRPVRFGELHGQLLLAGENGNQQALGQGAAQEQDAGGDEERQASRNGVEQRGPPRKSTPCRQAQSQGASLPRIISNGRTGVASSSSMDPVSHSRATVSAVIKWRAPHDHDEQPP